ncbi:hypothetical protein [Bowmanella denitrificans]|uniref:hypothetical protein n=1 Tax=Bowmanella denitrificans TaxID=366582 RepID=UPI000C9C88B3|nr:hypothetical protein [Bowmanella denitrificans]
MYRLGLPPIFLIACLIFEGSADAADKKHVTDAVVDLDYKASFTALAYAHDTKVLIDRVHPTIYQNEGDEHGAHAMLDILLRDGFSYAYIDKALDASALIGDILIIHGLPEVSETLPNGATFWKSGLSAQELQDIVHFVDGGGGLFLVLSHHPGGSGAKALLDALGVEFRDGYLFTSLFPSFVSADDRCSHFFGMSEKDGLLNTAHPLLAMGETVRKVDFLCGAAVFRQPQDAVLRFPPGSANFNQDNSFHESSDYYAGMLAFEYGRGRVVITTDQGMFRNFIFTFDHKEKVHVTISSPDNDNAKLFVNTMRWLSSRISATMQASP